MCEMVSKKQVSGGQLPIINFDEFAEDGGVKKQKRHSNILPDSIRAVFCGPSNCGKTNALLTLLIHPNGLKFENIYLYSKSLMQPKYRLLEKLLQPVKGVEFYPFNAHEQVVAPSDAQPNSIFIFDDIACEKQDNVRAYFSMGRHEIVDSFYLCQTYTRIPKHLVRDNANFVVLFKQDDMNLKHAYNDHVNTDMTYACFKNMCVKCWKSDKYGFITIDKDSEINAGRYRRGFDYFLTVEDK